MPLDSIEIFVFLSHYRDDRGLLSFPTRRSSDLWIRQAITRALTEQTRMIRVPLHKMEKMKQLARIQQRMWQRSEEHTSELQSHVNLVCRLLLEKKNPT